MAAVAFSTTASSLNVCIRFVPLSFAVLYSPFTKSSRNQSCRYFSTNRIRRSIDHYGLSLPRHRPTTMVSNSSIHCLKCAFLNSRWLPSFVQFAPMATAASSQQVIEGDVNIQYRHGLPVLTLTLPSRGERCEFALRPITQTVADLCEYVRKEDRGVDTIGVYRKDGAKISGLTSIEHLMQTDFHIRINDRLYLAQPPKQELLTAEHIQQLNDVKSLVATLHASLNADEQSLRFERELAAKLETMRKTLEPLEKQRQLIEIQSDKRTNRLLWGGLALMGVQLGAFARLTWFEYSWDIMEPVTYFATYTAVIGGYAYFAATRIQYEYPDAKERIALNKFYKLSRKLGFDVAKYNNVKENIFELEQRLKHLRQSPNFSAYKGSQPIDTTITVIRDIKSTSSASGSKSDQKPMADDVAAAKSQEK